MEEIKRGGKRDGAGRKPSGVQKETISIFVEKGKIWQFGTKDKLKQFLYDSINKFGIQDFTKPTNEIKPHEQPKTNYVAQVLPSQESPVMSQLEALKQLIKETTRKEELEKVMLSIEGVSMLMTHKIFLRQFAKDHSVDFFND